MSYFGANFLHLNRDGEWPGFAWRNLDLDDSGELSLASLPALEEPAMAGTTGSDPTSQGEPEGLAVGPDGAVFWTGPAARGRAVFRRDPCDGHCALLALDPDAQLADPRGLAIHPGRGALLIADRGRDRIILVALHGYQLIGAWGRSGSAPGELRGPTGLAVDENSAVYVVDGGNTRVQKLSAEGRPLATYEEAADPVAIAVDQDILWIVDAAERSLVRHEAGTSQQIPLAFGGPSALASSAGRIYLGDALAERLVRTDPHDGRTLGEAKGYSGPVAALATAGQSLWLHPGGAGKPLQLDIDGATVRQGVLWGGPVSVDGEPHFWRRLVAAGGVDGSATLYVYASNETTPPPDPDPAALRNADGGFAAPWQRVGTGDPDGLVCRTSSVLWVGVLLSSDGQLPGPRIEQLRISFDETGYEQHLPVIYRLPEKVGLEGDGSEPLERLLALFESFYHDIDGSIDGLRRLFSPSSTPSDWIDWLAAWLAEPLDEAWPDEHKRRLIASAFERAAWRGTAAGLRRNLAERLGITAGVEEPHAQTGWWALPHAVSNASTARLGLDTRLAASEPQGAVLDRSAVVDGSQLIEGEDVGEPLFSRTAHQFSVVLPRAAVSAPVTLDRVRQLIDLEKPAHTAYCLRLVEPGVTVGYQALLGVDTLLGDGSVATTRLGERPEPLAAGGDSPIHIGAGEIGVTTRLAGGVGKTNRETSREETPWAF